MAINSDIRDHAYQFFTEEAPELLQILESGLLTLDQRSTAKVHNLMRAAHSIKGGAASVGLETIATLAHRLENILKALYSDSLEVDTALENDLLRAYDCLKLPLMEQITTGHFDPDALAIADPIFTQIEIRCGDALLQTETYLPSSAELGVDMITSIFEVDVVQGLERLAAMLAHPQDYEVAGELRAQIEVFIGFAELLNLPEFKTIAETAQRALNAHPDWAIEITQLTLIDLERSRQAVLAGDRTQGLKASETLLALASGVRVDKPILDVSNAYILSVSAPNISVPNISVPDITDISISVIHDADVMAPEPFGEPANLLQSALPQLENLFGGFGVIDTTADLAIEPNQPLEDAVLSASEAVEALAIDSTEPLDAITPVAAELLDEAIAAEITAADIEIEAAEQLRMSLPQLESVFGVFGSALIGADLLIDQDAAIDQDQALDDTRLSISESFVIDQTEMLDGSVLALPESLSVSLDEGDSLFPEMADADRVTPQNLGAPLLDRPVSLVPFDSRQPESLQIGPAIQRSPRRQPSSSASFRPVETATPPNLTVRVDSDRLARMGNLVGELTINRNGLSLQNEQLQGVLRELLNRFSQFEGMVGHLRESLDQLLVAPEHQNSAKGSNSSSKTDSSSTQNNGRDSASDLHLQGAKNDSTLDLVATEFDSLEMDSYGVLHAQLQEILENFVQLDETVDDVTLYARQSDRLLDQHRYMLTNLSGELTQARMLPLGEVLNRFPRILRDLSATYHKPVSLKLTGTSLLVDRAILEKLYDPLLHLLRNAFDHGIEFSPVREQLGKPKEGQIEIRAYYKGNQTIIEIEDDGQGLNLDRIRNRAFELGWLSSDQLQTTSPNRLFELIFEPGFSTAPQVSELSGRGIGLDVVRSQLQLIKGTVVVASSPRQGTTFKLCLPLTLTNTKLIICTAATTTLAIPLDNVEEIVTPQSDQIRRSGTQRFLYWREQIIPAHRLAALLNYACLIPEVPTAKSWSTASAPKTAVAPMLILRQQDQLFAIEVDQLITEQELVVKSFGSLIDPPSYLYGCTSLGDGSLIPVIDSSALLAFEREQKTAETLTAEAPQRLMNGHSQSSIQTGSTVIQSVQVTTILVVDDAVTLRRTLALSLERAGFRVLQARDGREAIDQCQRSSVNLVICDIEMPNMNGFEFLSYRRQDAQISKIPIIMLTSRSNDKHRWLAMQLGATDYFTKPYLEQELLTAIRTLFKPA